MADSLGSSAWNVWNVQVSSIDENYVLIPAHVNAFLMQQHPLRATGGGEGGGNVWLDQSRRVQGVHSVALVECM